MKGSKLICCCANQGGYKVLYVAQFLDFINLPSPYNLYFSSRTIAFTLWLFFSLTGANEVNHITMQGNCAREFTEKKEKKLKQSVLKRK